LQGHQYHGQNRRCALQTACCGRSGRAAKGRYSHALVDHQLYVNRDSFDQRSLAQIDSYQPDLVILRRVHA